VSNWKKYIETGSARVTTDKMEEMLLKYGAEVAKEKVWKLPRP